MPRITRIVTRQTGTLSQSPPPDPRDLGSERAAACRRAMGAAGNRGDTPRLAANPEALTRVSPPLCLVVASFPKRDGNGRSGLGPTQPVAEAHDTLNDVLGKDRAWSDVAERAATEFARALLAAGTICVE